MILCNFWEVTNSTEYIFLLPWKHYLINVMRSSSRSKQHSVLGPILGFPLYHCSLSENKVFEQICMFQITSYAKQQIQIDNLSEKRASTQIKCTQAWKQSLAMIAINCNQSLLSKWSQMKSNDSLIKTYHWIVFSYVLPLFSNPALVAAGWQWVLQAHLRKSATTLAILWLR